jgi:hypothetical protein
VNLTEEDGANPLGMTAQPSRRDFLNGTLLAAAGALLNSVSIAQILAQDHHGGRRARATIEIPTLIK